MTGRRSPRRPVVSRVDSLSAAGSPTWPPPTDRAASRLVVNCSGIGLKNNNMEAVDAKLERARGQPRRLKGDVAAFCQERSRLILPEQCGDRRLWVYRGGDPSVPVRWSVLAGEFAHNLLDPPDQPG